MLILWRSAVIVALVSCAPVAPPAVEPEVCYACDELAAEQSDGAGNASAESNDLGGAPSLTVVPEPEEAPDRWATRSIGAPAEGATRRRPPRARRVDVSLLRAPFDDVARFLADAGRFDIVLDAPSAHDVTVSLHDVEPYEALALIAETQGLTVSYRRGVVIVSR